MPARRNPLLAALGWLIIKLMGFNIVGKLPEEKKLLIIAAPHTSALDYVIAMAAIQYIGADIRYIMKKEAFTRPLGWFYSWLGGIPVDRFKQTDIIEQTADWFKGRDSAWLAMAPEGTRKKVEKWKTGFLRIAKAADVPILVAGLNAGKKQIVIDKVIRVKGNHNKQAAELQAYTNSIFQGFKSGNH